MWRTGKTSYERPPLEPPALETGGHFPFAVVSDSALNFRPSAVSANTKNKGSKDNKSLTQVCNFFSSSGNRDTHLLPGGNTSAWNSAAPGWENYR
eukprot:10809778-Alexandrium_andersonii.AAC.1